MVRRVIRFTIVAWLVGAGVQWARRHGRSFGPLDRILDDHAPGKPPRRRSSASAKAQLAKTAAREASSSRTGRPTTTGATATAAWTTARPQAAAAEPESSTAEPEAATVEPKVTIAEPEAPTGDDLKVIEGIGPKFDKILRAADVHSFEKLAAMDPDAIQTIMREAGARMADPTTWPEQARLAAAGEWDALAEMQSRLKGGRKVNAD